MQPVAGPVRSRLDVRPSAHKFVSMNSERLAANQRVCGKTVWRHAVRVPDGPEVHM
jgi:hypothetical protein